MREIVDGFLEIVGVWDGEREKKKVSVSFFSSLYLKKGLRREGKLLRERYALGLIPGVR